jgi:hypothetical protein
MTKTIKVRVPGVVAPDGRWCLYGYPEAEKRPDWGMIEEVADNDPDHPCYEYRRVWVTVELPLPEPAQLTAELISGDQ